MFIHISGIKTHFSMTIKHFEYVKGLYFSTETETTFISIMVKIIFFAKETFFSEKGVVGAKK